MQSRPLPSIDRAALLLIRKYGDDCAVEAYRRSSCCAYQGLGREAAEWRAVMRRVVALHFARRPDRLT